METGGTMRNNPEYKNDGAEFDNYITICTIRIACVRITGRIDILWV